MTRNPSLPIAAVSDPIKVALLSDDPLLRAGLSSLLAQLGSIDVVERDSAEVALWDAGVDASKALSRLHICDRGILLALLDGSRHHCSRASTSAGRVRGSLFSNWPNPPASPSAKSALVSGAARPP